MTKEAFTGGITAMTKTLYRVSCGLLRGEADREDAVQETILRAWEKLDTLKHEEFFQTWVVRILINECRSIGRQRGRVIAVAAALALGVAGAAYAAGWFGWSRDLEHEMHTTEQQRQYAEQIGLAAAPEVTGPADNAVTTVTDKGVTVTATQTLVDNYYAMLSFRIDGFELPEDEYPCTSSGVQVGGQWPATMSGGFYDGIVTGEDGHPVYDDGSPLRFNDDGEMETHYVDENGSLVYQISLSGSNEPGYYLGKEIEVVFTNFGYMDETGVYPAVVEGDWMLRWTLTGSDEIRTVAMDTEIGGTGVILKEAEISPISLRVLVQTDGVWEGYKTMDSFYPWLAGVRLKDGTVYQQMFLGPGHEGYYDLDACLYDIGFGIDRILDPGEVDALVFITGPEDGNLCFVPIG